MFKMFAGSSLRASAIVVGADDPVFPPEPDVPAAAAAAAVPTDGIDDEDEDDLVRE